MTKIEHALPRDVVTVFHVIEAVQELYGDQAADKVTGRAIERLGYTLPGSARVQPVARVQGEPVAVPDGWKLVPVQPTESWVHRYANRRQGQRSEPRCEGPSEYDLGVARELINEMLAAAPAAPPGESGEVERLRARIDYVTKQEGLGGAAAFWRPCTGCHETNEGYSAGFPRSKTFGCEVGSGCWECGGLGVIWEHHSKADLKALAEEATAPPPEPAKAKLGLLPIFRPGSLGDRIYDAMLSYLGTYAFGVDDGPDHTPTEFERAMIVDFLSGVMSNDALCSILQESARALAEHNGREGS